MDLFLPLKKMIWMAWLSGVLTGASAAEPQTEEETTAVKKDQSESLTDKIVYLQLKGNGGSSVLEHVETKRLGSRSFVVGQIADMGIEDRLIGRTVWISVDRIAKMCEFKNLEEAKKTFPVPTEEKSSSTSNLPSSIPTWSVVPPTNPPAESNPLEEEQPGNTSTLPVRVPMWSAVPPAAEPSESNAEEATNSDVIECDNREFLIPYTVSPEQAEVVEKCRLFISKDEGKTWDQYSDFATNETLQVSVSEDGLFYFAFQVVTKTGEKIPADSDSLVPAQKIRVKTQPTRTAID